jgi:UDPglucose 6-dehydrogenase
LAVRAGAFPDLAEATDRFNRAQIKWIADLVRRHYSGNGSIGILGLTYKPDTDVVEEAFGLLLAQELSSANLPVVAYDPSAEGARALCTYKTVRLADSAQECIAQSDVVVLATPWQEFREIPAAQWVRHSRARAVIDCWRALNHLDGVDGVDYVRLGFGGEAQRPVETSSSAR